MNSYAKLAGETRPILAKRGFTRIFGGRRVRWEPAWQAYPGAIDEAPAAWLVDLAAVDAAPVLRLPVRLDIRLPYPGGGLPAEADLNRLGAFDGRVRAIAAEHDGVFVGRVACAGLCRYTAHLPAAAAQPPRGASLDGAEVSTEYDPHWAYVRDHLAPDERQAQLLADLLVVTALRQHGDVLDRIREVEHVALFAGPDPANDAATALRAEGFSVAVERDDEGEFVLLATRRDAVVPPAVHEVSWTVKESIERHGGSYDGWSCAVSTA
ncbi:MAG: DUF695 domain-containing protein [Micromonosporaceae bacterium]